MLVSTTGLFPFSPVVAGAEEEPVALLAGVGHPGAQHPVVDSVGAASLLGRGPALSLSADVPLGGYSLSDDGPLLATSSLLSLLLVFSLGIGYGNGKTTTYPDQRRQRLKMRSYGCALPVPDFSDDYRKTLNPSETRRGSPFYDSSSPD